MFLHWYRRAKTHVNFPNYLSFYIKAKKKNINSFRVLVTTVRVILSIRISVLSLRLSVLLYLTNKLKKQ